MSVKEKAFLGSEGSGLLKAFACLTLSYSVPIASRLYGELTNYPITGFLVLLELILVLGFAAAGPSHLTSSLIAHSALRWATLSCSFLFHSPDSSTRWLWHS